MVSRRRAEGSPAKSHCRLHRPAGRLPGLASFPVAPVADHKGPPGVTEASTRDQQAVHFSGLLRHVESTQSHDDLLANATIDTLVTHESEEILVSPRSCCLKHPVVICGEPEEDIALSSPEQQR